MSGRKNVFLDVDPTIIEKNLHITDNSAEDDFSKLFQPPGEQYPSKLIKPFPGFCIKTKEIGTDTKLFINVCYTDAIPPPKDITESQLSGILESDEASDFRVPMSIGDARSETDKKGEEAKVIDVAIHESFFKKIQNSALFKSFFSTIVFEGLQNKHGVVTQDEKIVLKNRKVFGNLQIHRIQQREINEKMKTDKLPLESLPSTNNNKPLIEVISSNDIECRVPEYKLFRKRSIPNCLLGEFNFPDVISSKQLTLDVGEDRIVLECPSKHYLLDIFIPCMVRQSAVSSNFNKMTKILTVTMPLIGG